MGQRAPARKRILSTAGAAKQARKALAMYHAEDPALLARVSVSSDAFGSWPVFDERGRLTSYEARAPWQPMGHVCMWSAAVLSR